MTLPPATAAAINEACKEVTRLSAIAEQVPDTEGRRRAYIATRDAIIRAVDLINVAEREVREAAIYRVERAA